MRLETRGPISSQAVVGNDGTIYVGSHDGFLYALRPSGEEKWRVPLEERVYMTPYVDSDGNVFVGSDADVYVKVRPNGEVAWRLSTEGDADTATTPGADGTLHFAAGNDLWAVKPDGTALWRFRARGKIYTAPAIGSDGTLYVGAQDDRLYAIAPDGRMRWEYQTRGDNDASPAIGDDGTIFFGSDDRHVYAVGTDGTLRWKTWVDGYVRAPAAIGPSAIFCGVFGPRARLVALDMQDGHLLWEFPVTAAPSSEVGIASAPLLDHAGNLYFGAHDDFVYSLSSSGRLRWAIDLHDDVDGAATILDDGTLLIGGDDRVLHAFQNRDGHR